MNQQSELIQNPDGSIYHLNLLPGELAHRILLVGDPGRVKKISQHFDRIDLEKQKREFVTVTGEYHGTRMSVVSTGIGPDNIDIVINEIDALFNIDFQTRKVKNETQSLKLLRLGTCGGMQADVPVGTLVSSRYAVGADTLGNFYQLPVPEGLVGFKNAFKTFHQQHPELSCPLYPSAGSESLERLILRRFTHVLSGITFTASGFYGPQGRDLGRLSPALPQLPDVIADFAYNDLRVLNMEMETSAIFSLGGALGHETGAISVILANRPAGTFSQYPAPLVDDLIETGLSVMENW